jgi:peptidyl-prolyl cis-trans isomerase SurA
MDRVVAVVNQEVITWSELYHTMEMDASPRVKALSDRERREVFQKSEASFLEKLIDIRLQLQEAKRLRVRVTEGEVDAAIESIKSKYAMDDTAFKQSLEQQGLTLEQYRRRLQEKVMLDRVVGKVIRSSIVVSDEDVGNYIRDNTDAIEEEERYRISQIFLKNPADPEMRNELELKAAEIIEKSRKGEQFSDLAQQYSEEPSSKSGGDLGYIKKQDLNRQFRGAVSELTPGEISKPFWTQKGLHIIQLMEKAGPVDDEKHFEKAREKLFKDIFTKKYRAWIKHLRETSFIEIRL